ncbi:unnamed protein product [Lasius platythorax]|uniref:HAT C-terminal dimerisation domain-containing protein n=1 Tax=Lasius platythorax TaxID=488582 RepID=A0AAV2N3R6_9HYME
MPKTQSRKKTYVQKYIKNWELYPNFKGWLKPSPDGDSTNAFCAYCKTILNAHKKTLQDHGISKKHIQSAKNQQIVATLPKIDTFAKITLSQQKKVAELKIATYVAEHCSIKTVDHLSIMIKSLDEESRVLQDIKLHRTKCSALIKNVLSPCILEELIEDINQSYFSLILDESTTIDTKKILCLMMRYFSESKKKIVTTFYRLIEIKAGTSDAIAEAVLHQLKTDGLKPEKLLGLGVDGASVNVGRHHSVTTILREINPELIVITCICHSFHLAAEATCKALPRHLDFMVRETHSWFSHSTKRQLEYAEIYKTLAGILPKKIVQLSNTRWLVRLQAIDTILEQWDALKLHFQITESNKERCYTAHQLYGMYCTPENKLFLTFLSSSLKGVMAMNRLFQSESVDPMKLFEDVNNLIYSNLQTLVVPSRLQKISRYELAIFYFKQHLMPLECMNFGYEFNNLSVSIKPETVIQIKERCRDFLSLLCSELQKRIPENIKMLEKISTFSPESASSQIKADITEIASKLKKSVCTNIDCTIREWNLLHTAQVKNCTSTESFWVEVYDIKDAGGTRRFENISKLVLALLSLPFSNASVERAFSIMSIVKDKLRNKMSIVMVEAIMHIRLTLNIDCCDFKPTATMLKRFNTETIYTNINENDVAILDVFPDK